MVDVRGAAQAAATAATGVAPGAMAAEACATAQASRAVEAGATAHGPRAADAGPGLEAGHPAATAGSGPAADPEAPYVRLAVVALVCEAVDGRWLLIRAPRSPESWGPPGGRVERGESLADALHRELMEEVGLRVHTAGPCYAYVTMHKGERTVGVHMACRTTVATPAVRLDPAEAADHRWVTAEEWVEMAHAGLTPWDPDDVVRVTTLAGTLLEIP